MNYFSFIFRSSLSDLFRNKGRTLLTSLGILIGVMAVVLLMALGLGLKKYISNQFDSLGANLIYIIPGNTKNMAAGMVGGIKFDDRDVQKIQRVDNIIAIAPVFSKPLAEIEAGGKTEAVEVIASNEHINAIMNLQAQEGRLITHNDIMKHLKGMVISPKTATALFGNPVNAVGKQVTVEGQVYKIIGVYKSKGGGGLGGADMDSHAFIPSSAALVFNPDKKYLALYAKAESKETIPVVKREVEAALLKRYDDKQFSVVDQSEIMETVTAIFSIINLVLVSIAAISLVVGGIGIMNIMYVTVSERVREIGIRRALGAHKTDILYQFLFMSVILSVIGGAAGLGISYAIVAAVQSLFPAYINAESIALALGVSSIIGIVFGVFPAKQAADLSPMDAIRYE